jgi:hypothetical protein
LYMKEGKSLKQVQEILEDKKNFSASWVIVRNCLWELIVDIGKRSRLQG